MNIQKCWDCDNTVDMPQANVCFKCAQRKYDELITLIFTSKGGMYSLQDVKDQYYRELARNEIDRMDLDAYINEYFVPCYDGSLKFLGYERATV